MTAAIYAKMSTAPQRSFLALTFLAFKTISADAEELVVRGIPDHRVESHEAQDSRIALSDVQGKAAEVVIVLTDQGCVWRSRDDRPVTAKVSGGYVIFETGSRALPT